ncbi:MAG: phytoene/squalene synthase family protein [Candidatus Omnitrophota bacterium]
MDSLTERGVINSGFTQARRITREYAKTFYFSSKFLPRAQRDAVYAIYVVCRDSDEAVDDMKLSPKQEYLSRVKENIEAAYNGSSIKESTLLAFRETVNKFKIPREYFLELIEGMRMDLEKNRYRNFQELYHYCYKVAGVIGLIMLKVFGSKENEAEKYAIDLGIAMQLTNILRDIKEDWERGRVYLPQEEMENYGVNECNIAQAKVDDNFKRLMEFQIQRARGYYTSSLEGFKFIPSRRMRFVTLSILRMYSAILDKIERGGFDVFLQRAHISGPRKLFIGLQNLFKI